LVFHFPKQKLIYGPEQIEARIDQDPEISKLLTLWDQGGSMVIRGSLLVFPIEGSLLYVQPIYLAAEKGQMPELKRVVIIHSDKIVMAKNLQEGLNKIFGIVPTKADIESMEVLKETVLQQPQIDTRPRDLLLKEAIKKSYDLMLEAEKCLKENDWSGYGEKLKEVKEILRYFSEEK
jgi:hypothetical protein